MFLTEYEAAGRPLLSHSEAYRAAYHPAYRVLPDWLALYLPLLARIEARLASGTLTILGIDGRCGAGKTTLAGILSNLYKCSVIHMDQFFLPRQVATPERLAQPGGNVDSERFLYELAPRLRENGPLRYRAYHCGTGEYAPLELERTPLIVVEGTYSLHPSHAGLYDCTAFLTVPPEVQLARLAQRESSTQLARFRNEWIPLEEAYFNAFAIARGAALVFDTSLEFPV